MPNARSLASEHRELTRRCFLRLGSAGIASLSLARSCFGDEPPKELSPHQALEKVIAEIQYLTRAADFGTVERGNPLPSELPEETRRAVGLARDTWRLEVVPDKDSDAKVEQPLSADRGTALDWAGLMQLAEKKAVRYLKVMTCNNMNAPLGMGLWEGVPLRDVVWLARPTENIRRVFYYGYHNDKPEQMFRSSLPVNRVLEDPPGEWPVLLCYKLNGEWLSPKRGGPVRMLVPEAYGFKSVKWLQRVVLTNDHRANDTYADGNNDVESWQKTFARFGDVPERAKAGQAIPITGLAQVGMGGLAKVQCALDSAASPPAADDPYFTKCAWHDADLLPPPKQWGAELADGKLPDVPLQFDPATGRPRQWPLRYTLAHWATLVPGVAAGKYHLRCRTIDLAGDAQPLPRPYLKSGRNAIQSVTLEVEDA
ncbi:MAG: molybdopterin-dependent oxidoreductase [Planctomycetia bacterium]|nr:molybdopterin-dependent oxidoreductase [Planctomycetia bacterium]